MKKFFAMILALMLVLSIFSACGQTTPNEPATPTSPAQGFDELAVPTDPISVEPVTQYKENVVIGMQVSVNVLDPHVRASTGEVYLFETTHDKLVTFDLVTQKFSPELATEWEWISDTELKMKLRDDVTFHNGEHFTADDVAFTFNRGKELDLSPFHMMESVEVVNDYEIIIKLNTINVDFMNHLARSSGVILNREAVDADESNGPAVGTGPWVLDEFYAGDYTTLKVNENYWGEIPKAKTMRLTYIPESSARLIALENGEIDVCINLEKTDSDYVIANEALEYIKFGGGTTNFLAFDVSEAPGNNKDLRLAFAYAIDKQEIIDVARNGFGIPAVSNWGRWTYGLDTEMEDYGRDLEKAKEHLEASGIKEITITCKNSMLDLVTVVQAQMKEIGLTVHINELESAALVATIAYDTHGHDVLAYNYGWSVFGDDARGPYFKDNNKNRAIINNEEIMQLIDAAAAEFDEAKRTELYHKVQQINHEECYYLPIYYSILTMATADDVTGINWDPAGQYDFSYTAVPIK